ncbi:VOC family protein [Thermomonospora umbrina]|uniref:Methylmalonyl-CoA epimerase n=1 Tax=Thermomonospora umbrina TaxID=111806 RepID=A0A3D9SK52_9ACTN|nr:VOC family protein [Thermomonospora umbrina]REE94770.1 methylmalonyl-CoA epimerase [Thermomonospora umbrina]
MHTLQTVPDADLGVTLMKANHVGIAVRDLDRTIHFYGALTGQDPFVTEPMQGVEAMYGPKVADRVGEGGVRLRYATLRLSNLNIDMIQFDDPEMGTAKALPTDAGAMHLCFEVSDLQAVYDRMTAAGIEFDAPPFTFTEEHARHGAGTQVAYFSDPDGVNLELIKPAGSFDRG